jgi:citrate/tricarballylate utilization protein
MPNADNAGPDAVTAEARRIMELCNICRYCNGYCAVFRAAARRRRFSDGDLQYLANLCHDCRNCYYACQYAPPHPFAINVPQTLALLRHRSWRDHAWPQPMGQYFHRNGLAVGVVTLALVAVMVALVAAQGAGPAPAADDGAGAFYGVVPWGAMVAVAGLALGWSLLALGMSVAAFWRSTGWRGTGWRGTDGARPAPGGASALIAALAEAGRDALTLRNLGGGGVGCNDRDEGFSTARRRLHHVMLAGLALCLASTVTASAYDHVLGLVAPYPLLSLPVVLGTLGGAAMVVGLAGLAWIKATRDPVPDAPATLGADWALLGQLFLVATSGLALLALRATPAMAPALAIHLGAVLALFVTLPYCKLAHGAFRAAALLRAAVERRVAGRLKP